MMNLPKIVVGCALYLLIAGCADQHTDHTGNQQQATTLSPLERAVVEQSGKSLSQLRAAQEQRQAKRRAELDRRLARQTSYSVRANEPVACEVTSENATLNSARRTALEVELKRTSVPAPPPGYREQEPMPTAAEIGDAAETIDATRPSQELLQRQESYFEGRGRIAPDLSDSDIEYRAELSREIASTEGMSPGEMGRAVLRGELSVDAFEAISLAEANRRDYADKYRRLVMIGKSEKSTD